MTPYFFRQCHCLVLSGILLQVKLAQHYDEAHSLSQGKALPAVPLPLFNEMFTHLYFKIWSGATSMSAAVLAGGEQLI